MCRTRSRQETSRKERSRGTGLSIRRRRDARDLRATRRRVLRDAPDKLRVDIDRDAELAVLSSHLNRQQGNTGQEAEKTKTVTQESLLRARRAIASNVVISDAIKVALVDISRELRRDSRVLQGNSTRSIVLMLPALKAAAALDGRSYVSAADIEKLLPHVFAHRLELAPGAGDVKTLLQEIMLPAMEQLARSTLR